MDQFLKIVFKNHVDVIFKGIGLSPIYFRTRAPV